MLSVLKKKCLWWSLFLGVYQNLVILISSTVHAVYQVSYVIYMMPSTSNRDINIFWAKSNWVRKSYKRLSSTFTDLLDEHVSVRSNNPIWSPCLSMAYSPFESICCCIDLPFRHTEKVLHAVSHGMWDQLHPLLKIKNMNI